MRKQNPTSIKRWDVTGSGCPALYDVIAPSAKQAVEDYIIGMGISVAVFKSMYNVSEEVSKTGYKLFYFNNSHSQVYHIKAFPSS